MEREVSGTGTSLRQFFKQTDCVIHPDRISPFHRDVAAEEVRERPARSAIMPQGLPAVTPDPQADAVLPKERPRLRSTAQPMYEAMQSFSDIEGRLHAIYLCAP